MAAPGNRDDGYVTKGSNGKVYHPVASDKRKLGAAHRRTKGSWSDETARSTKRNVWKAPSLIGLEESVGANYDSEEKLINESIEELEYEKLDLSKEDYKKIMQSNSKQYYDFANWDQLKKRAQIIKNIISPNKGHRE